MKSAILIRKLSRFAGALLVAGALTAATVPQEQPQPAKRPGVDGLFVLTVGKTLSIQATLPIERVSIASDSLAEAVPISATEILINGKAPGETTLIIWQKGGPRLVYDLVVRISPARLEAVRAQIAHDYPADDINVTFDNDTAFVRGTVATLNDAERVMQIAGTLGHTVNLMQVRVPDQAPQILLKVRFADVDRSASQQIGVNIASSAFNQTTAIGTGQFGTPGITGDGNNTFSLSQALNVLLFRRDIDLGVTIQLLQSKNLLQMLAEPNIMGSSGVKSSFLAGGEIPVPAVQGSSSVGSVTITYRPYGIQLYFLPEITPRGTIKLQVTPEVSSLDYAHSVTLSGFSVPGFTTRRLDTEVELESGQSFVVAGLLDNDTTESLSKIPGLSNIPILGKLFQSRSITKNNSELMVIVTPEIVRPIPAGQPVPALDYPTPFLPGGHTPLRQPGINATGDVPVHPPQPTMPAEQLMLMQKTAAPQQAPAAAPAGPPGTAPPRGTRVRRFRWERESRPRADMYPLTIGLAIENRDLMDQAQGCLSELPFRVIVEHQDTGDLSSFCERLERMRPDVVLIDISKWTEPLEEPGQHDPRGHGRSDDRRAQQQRESGIDSGFDARRHQRVSLSAAAGRPEARARKTLDGARTAPRRRR